MEAVISNAGCVIGGIAILKDLWRPGSLRSRSPLWAGSDILNASDPHQMLLEGPALLLQIEAFHGQRATGITHACSGIGIGQHLAQVCSESIGVAFVAKVSGLAILDALDDTGMAGCRERAARQHRLDTDERQTFGIARWCPL